MPADEIP